MKRTAVGPGRWKGAVGVGALLLSTAGAHGQTCTTQSHLGEADRTALAGAVMTLASDVKAADVAKVQAAAIAEFAANFAATAALVRTTGAHIASDSLEVTQLYLLDGSKRAAGDTSDASFVCELAGTTSETDFNIPQLPPGRYGFAMVEATGERPFLLSFLLRQQGDTWKLAGFYPHPRTAAGHDGLWFWTAARREAKSGNHWAAWVLFGEADALLRPAAFASSSNLDKLRAEQRAVAPPELADGLSAATPYVLKASGGTEFRFTGISSEGSDDGRRLNLLLHIDAGPSTDSALERTYNTDAARALLLAHKDLQTGFENVWVIAEAHGRDPVATEQTLAEALVVHAAQP